MTAPVEELLSTFDRLPESERLEIALEILKRVRHLDFPCLSNEDLVWNAEEIFLELDRQEASDE
ncbi:MULTISPECIES: hypothetical protein [unclassified Nostoc]|uniref:hypothetical protein n=1 Tax=unclassified Nostoc TaxID=2593658 RepID=UPI000DED0129|nr:hypothetical protein [Nostoc sp. ATCC 53789]QHG19135.1 hypothetical protein GJB62_26380 [Nostoc sp. ATCC 53789]RCJ18752.1 hypothetical protein A6V25_06345 [Nostoc sp. ATCC 53789]